MQTGSDIPLVGVWASRKKGPQCEIMNRRMGYCMKRIEVDLKCMRLEIGTKKLECREEKKKKRNLQEEMKEMLNGTA